MGSGFRRPAVRRLGPKTLVAVLLVASCSGPAVDSDVAELPSPYDFYSAILNDLADSAWYSPILIEPATWSAPDDSLAMDFLGPLNDFVGQAAASAFLEANQQSVMLADSFRSGANVELVSPFHQRVREVGASFWSAIRRDFGDNVVVIRFSRPGIDLAGGEALVYFAFYCGASMCAQGELVRLVLSEQGWLVDRYDVAWIS